MTGVQWLKLDKTRLNEIPEAMGKLMKLVFNLMIYNLMATKKKTSQMYILQSFRNIFH